MLREVHLGLSKQCSCHQPACPHSTDSHIPLLWRHKEPVTLPSVASSLQIALRILRILSAQQCQSRCSVGSGGKTVGYLAHGTATDYMYEVLKVPVATTWEVFGDMNAHVNDCFRMFNPVSSEQLEAVLLQWMRSLLQFLELLQYHPAVPLYNGQDIRQYTTFFAAASSNSNSHPNSSKPGSDGPMSHQHGRNGWDAASPPSGVVIGRDTGSEHVSIWSGGHMSQPASRKGMMSLFVAFGVIAGLLAFVLLKKLPNRMLALADNKSPA